MSLLDAMHAMLPLMDLRRSKMIDEDTRQAAYHLIDRRETRTIQNPHKRGHATRAINRSV